MKKKISFKAIKIDQKTYKTHRTNSNAILKRVGALLVVFTCWEANLLVYCSGNHNGKQSNAKTNHIGFRTFFPLQKCAVDLGVDHAPNAKQGCTNPMRSNFNVQGREDLGFGSQISERNRVNDGTQHRSGVTGLKYGQFKANTFLN